MSDVVARTIETTTHGRYLVRAPGTAPPHPLLIGFHGYGESAERHLEQLVRIPGIAPWLLVSVQGLHRFYSSRMEDVVASWMTRQDREAAIADNLAYVDRVVSELAREHDSSRLVFAGFSQGVAMALRAALLGATAPDAVIALGGDLPPDVRGRQASRRPAVLLGRGTRDSYYTEEKLQADRSWFVASDIPIETCQFDGGHEWSDEFRATAGAFLQRILTATEPAR